jgi:hypothetical protein
MQRYPSTPLLRRSLCLALCLGALGSGCAPAPEDPSEVEATARPLLSAIPDGSPNAYGLDGDNVYLQVQIGAEYGAFRVPIGAGTPVLLDPGGGARRTYFFQVVGGDLYYVLEVYPTGSRTPRYELRRVAAGSRTPVTEMELPMWAYAAVGPSDVYLQKSNAADGRYQSIYRLPRAAGAVASRIAPSEDSARDLVVVGGRAFWRAGWAGLGEESLYLATYDPATGTVGRVALGSGTSRIEIDHLMVDGNKLYVFGNRYRLWSVDPATAVATELPSLLTRMNAAGLAYCGDNYPYGLESSTVRAGSFYAYCTSSDYAKRQIHRFALDGSSDSAVAPIVSTRAWYLRSAGSNLLWLEKVGYDRHAFKSVRRPGAPPPPRTRGPATSGSPCARRAEPRSSRRISHAETSRTGPPPPARQNPCTLLRFGSPDLRSAWIPAQGGDREFGRQPAAACSE